MMAPTAHTPSLAELAEVIARHATPDAPAAQALPLVTLVAATAPTRPFAHVYEPMIALVVQGTKRVGLGDKVLDYGPGRYLIVPVDLPVDSSVVQATPQAPFLGLGFTLRPEAIASLLLEAPLAQPGGAAPSGIALGEVAADLLDPLLRLVRLLDRPADVPALLSVIEREILWRLLNGPQGDMVRQVGTANSRTTHIGRAVQWIRTHYAEAMRVDALAAIAGMSVTSFHRHFRAVTSMTPVQYQKQIRLQVARSRLLMTADDVASIGFSVGYESPSQFSREYRRLFGRPPGLDASCLRQAGRSAESPAV